MLIKNFSKKSSFIKLFSGIFLVTIVWLSSLYVSGSGVNFSSDAKTVSVSDLYFCLGRSNIYFVVTLGTEEYLTTLGLWDDVENKLSFSQPFVINANTHIGSIRDLKLDNNLFLVIDGVQYPHVGSAEAVSSHHNTYLVFFPKYDMEGNPLFERNTGNFEIIIENIDFERHYIFKYPLPILTNLSNSESLTSARILMLITAAFAGIMIACSPCLIGAMAVGSLTIASTVDSNNKSVKSKIRSKLIKNTLYFLISLVVSYMLIAIVIAVFKIDIASLRPIETLGGAILLIFGLYFLRVWKPVIKLEIIIYTLISKIHPNIKKYMRNKKTDFTLNPKSASTIGSTLSLVCSTAGAPTLSLSVVLPLMIYAGLSGLQWSFLIILIYLISVSIPFLLLTIGLGELILSKISQILNPILIINAFLLIGLGILLLGGLEFIFNLLSIIIRLIFFL